MTTAPTLDEPAAYFDRLAEVEAAHWWSLGIWRLASSWLDRALRGRRGLIALDVGCGTGLTAHRLSRRAEIDCVLGIEPSPAALDRARGRTSAPLVRGSALALPFADESLDLATCFDVLQHLPTDTDRIALAELRRVLRPGGLALIRSNAAGWSRRPERPGPDAPYRLGDLVGMIEGSGWRVRRSTYANCLPAIAQELRGRLRPRPGGSSAHPAGGGLRIEVPAPWINRIMGVVATAEAILAGPFAVPLPFGHSTLVLAERAD